MTRQTIIISSCEAKKANNGKNYIRVKTDTEGWCSAFEQAVMQELSKPENWNIPIDVEIVIRENGTTWKNITQFYGKADPAVIKPSEFGHEESKHKPNYTTMYTSYAKDMFIALWPSWATHPDTVGLAESCMQESIDLVKQAREAFS